MARGWAGKIPPPPPAETPWGPRGQAEARPMLPAHSAQAPGPQQKQSPFFQTAKRIHFFFLIGLQGLDGPLTPTGLLPNYYPGPANSLVESIGGYFF